MLQLKNGQTIWTDKSPKKIYRWVVNSQKWPHAMSSESWKLAQQWEIIPESLLDLVPVRVAGVQTLTTTNVSANTE